MSINQKKWRVAINILFLDFLTSRGLASVGDLVSQMYKLKTELPSTKPTLKFA